MIRYARRKRQPSESIWHRVISWRRVFLAVALAPWAIAPAIALLVLATNLGAVAEVIGGDRYFWESTMRFFEVVAEWTTIGVPLTYLITLLFGLPAHLLLVLANQGSWLNHALAGATGGLLVSFLPTSNLAIFVACVAFGAAVAWLGWFVAIGTATGRFGTANLPGNNNANGMSFD